MYSLHLINNIVNLTPRKIDGTYLTSGISPVTMLVYPLCVSSPLPWVVWTPFGTFHRGWERIPIGRRPQSPQKRRLSVVVHQRTREREMGPLPREKDSHFLRSCIIKNFFSAKRNALRPFLLVFDPNRSLICLWFFLRFVLSR